jgi:D-tyrosyl-tRNA(Tyr) deacylase
VRVVMQRVLRASVRRVDVEPREERGIGPGLLLLTGFRSTDDDAVVTWMAEKCLGLRIFDDDTGAMNRSVADAGGSIIVVPNFTLYADAQKGRRPSFIEAALPEIAAARFRAFAAALRRGPVPVETGFFQASMQVELVNQGPVTIWLVREADRAAG